MEEFLSQFGVDWKLLFAQAINFFILFAVLKVFFFGPVGAILRRRREEIAAGIALKEEAEAQIAKSGEMYDAKIKEAERASHALITRAQELAGERREEIIADAARKSEAVVREAKRMIREEKAKMNEQFAREARMLVRDGIASVLQKMPPKERDRELIARALEELKT